MLIFRNSCRKIASCYIKIKMMNIELLMDRFFIIVIIVLFWLMPNKKIKSIRKFLTSLLQVLPISKIAEAFIAYINTKKSN